MNPAFLLAVSSTLAAGALSVPAGGRPPSPRTHGAVPGRSARRAVLLLAGLPAALLVAAGPRPAMPALIAVSVVLGTTRLRSSRRRSAAAAGHRARAVDLCDALQAELAAGQTPEAALDRAAADWALAAPAARAAASGGDVPAALREIARVPGAGSLRVVAAAWQVAHRTGHGLADTLGRVAEELRAAEQTRRVVAGELASARATARLLAGLPVVALLMGTGAGAAPWGFLLGQPAGLACLTVGLGLGYAGLAWVEALARDVDRDA